MSSIVIVDYIGALVAPLVFNPIYDLALTFPSIEVTGAVVFGLMALWVGFSLTMIGFVPVKEPLLEAVSDGDTSTDTKAMSNSEAASYWECSQPAHGASPGRAEPLLPRGVAGAAPGVR